MVAEANGAFLKATIDKRILNYVKQNNNEDEYGDNIGDTITVFFYPKLGFFLSIRRVF